jgi:acyl carrier protein
MLMDVQQELRAILKKRLSPGTDIEANTKLADAGLDSLDIVEMSFDFEERFRIELPPLAGNFAEMTFGDLCRLAEQALAKTANDKASQPSSS